LDTIPIDALLGAGQGKTPALTTKQREFAKAVAMGKTKAQAYRESYKANPAPSTMLSEPYIVAANPIVAREIEAYRAAIEAEKHRTPAQLKALLVQQLVQHSLDDDFPPASRVQCLKLLGSLFEVQAFTEHKTVERVDHKASDIRTRLLSRLQAITVDADIVADDALDLLAEIKQGRPDPATAAEIPAPATEGTPSDPTAGAPPDSGPPRTGDPSHTIPLKRSELETEINDFDK
jgi:hypothetical protein